MPRHFNLERLMGVEPTYAAWEAAVLPMNYSRRNVLYYSRPFIVLQHEKWRLAEKVREIGGGQNDGGMNAIARSYTAPIRKGRSS